MVLAVGALVAGACSSGTDKAEESNNDSEAEAAVGFAVPGAEWATTDAASAGLDQAALDEITAQAEASDSNCFLVARDGEIVEEHYWNGTGAESSQEVFSASKSFTATIAGIASDDGAFDTSEPASNYIDEWVGTPSESVTIENLLSNDSGREQTFETDYVEMAALAENKTEYSINLGQDEAPGEKWVYNNAAIQVLEEVIERSTGQDMAELADERLFDPIGMNDTSIIRDNAGNPLTFMGVQSTCRDMARFGALALNNGDWDGEEVVSTEWMTDSTGHPSQDLNASYGRLWWLNRPGQIVNPAEFDENGEPLIQQGQAIVGAPDDLYWASGLGGQYVIVDPTSGLIVVRLADSERNRPVPFGPKEASAVITEAQVTAE